MVTNARDQFDCVRQLNKVIISPRTESLSFGRAWELRADWLLTSSRTSRTTSGAQHDLQMTLGYAF